jgi:hypothetical protein
MSVKRGQFKIPRMHPSRMAVEIDATQFAMLLDGMDFGRVRRVTSVKVVYVASSGLTD